MFFLLILPFVAGTEPAIAATPTVSLTVSGPQLGTTYFAGDSFILAVHGAANQLVTVSQTRGSLMLPAVPLQTDVNGDLAVPGTWTTADVGTYTQTWYVGGVAANPVLTFQIAALPTATLTVTGPQSGTTYQVSDTYRIAVTGPSGQPVTVRQNGSMSGQLGTITGGTWSTGGTWTYSEIGAYTQTWYVGGIAATPSFSMNIIAATPFVMAPNNMTVATIWYFGGAPALDAGYTTTTILTLTPGAPADPNARIQWSTDSPSKISLTPSTDGSAVTVRSLSPSSVSTGYDIHVTATYDGTPSAPFPLFINTPKTMRTSLLGQYCTSSGCDCASVGHPGQVGYVTQLKHQIAGLDGVWFTTPISVNESLEKQQYTLASYQTAHANGDAPYPPQSAWAPSTWVTDSSGTKFVDFLSICAAPTWPYTPRPSSYNASGTTAVFNETQKLWVGSRTPFQGTCVQRGIVTLYTDHGTLTDYTSPITNASDCNQGNVIN